MITINNRKGVLLYYLLYTSVLFIPLGALLYFNYSELFIIWVALLIFFRSIQFFFSKYSEIKTYSDYVVIKVYSMAGRAPLHFSPIAFVDIKSFCIDEKQKKIVFHTEFEENSRMTSYSTRYFTKKQLSKLKIALSQCINGENLQTLSA
ncbi:hypothetical protein [Chryseobacterium sp. JM1]|uniref:hypothetical protein n=1 Tax=Chryseobacterium sp. JM1 TaxID=1233950 RepID=UPI0004E71DE7|nr:hypothetical protein [Chryseobacterium sp. JM1]KFF22552.1 hypothetical protein IW22_05090 [Chryseobacterium sp. JM1]